MLNVSKVASSTIFGVFGMTQPGIEPKSPWPLPNTLLIRPMAQYKWLNTFSICLNYNIKCLNINSSPVNRTNALTIFPYLLDRNTWYKTVSKKFLRPDARNVNINRCNSLISRHKKTLRWHSIKINLPMNIKLIWHNAWSQTVNPILLARIVEYTNCTSAPHPTNVLGMTLNCISWWGSSPGALENVEYLFITITSRSTLTWIGSTC